MSTTTTQILIPFLSAFVPLLIYVISGLIYLGRIRTEIKANRENLCNLKGSLKNGDGQPVYMTKKDCVLNTREFRVQIHSSIADLKNMIHDNKELIVVLHEKQQNRIDELDAKREKAKDEYAKELRDISQFMGQVQQYLSDDMFNRR